LASATISATRRSAAALAPGCAGTWKNGTAWRSASQAQSVWLEMMAGMVTAKAPVRVR
jgi:hypothetical protein